MKLIEKSNKQQLRNGFSFLLVENSSGSFLKNIKS